MRSKSYREYVSSLPCARCKVERKSQPAHYTGIRQHAFGAGRGIKADDLMIAPLCWDNCHPEADAYRLGTHDDRYTRQLEQSEEFLFMVLQTIRRAVEDGVLRFSKGQPGSL